MCLWFSMIFSFLAILQVLHCALLIFHVFDYFWPYSKSNIVCVSFSTVFQYSCHIPGLTLYISPFSRFSVFLAIFQVIHCFCLILHILQFFHQNSGPTVFISHFPRFSVFSSKCRSHSVHLSYCKFFSVSCNILVPTVCVFLFFHVFQWFLPYSRSYNVHFLF